ncbi:toll/interleukin-1 receptor domain-containing protein [Streptomyces sp. NPDC055189]
MVDQLTTLPTGALGTVRGLLDAQAGQRLATGWCFLSISSVRRFPLPGGAPGGRHVSMHAFVSHNHRDKPWGDPTCRALAAARRDVWLDSRKIRPGDRIPGKVNEALGLVDTIMVFWSANSSHSPWVNTEREAALTRRPWRDSVRVIPVVLDNTPLPPLLEPTMWVSLVEGDVDRAARERVGMGPQAELLKTMQRTGEESGLEYTYCHGFGVMVGCPRCGAPSSKLVPGIRLLAQTRMFVLGDPPAPGADVRRRTPHGGGGIP